MRNIKTFMAIAIIAMAFASCSTPLKVAEVKPVMEKPYEKENMEFIGFKNANRNQALIKDFGAELERRHIALNRQDFYMGVYSLQELETYKSTMRYISFVDISRLRNVWNDNVYDKDGLELGGWIIAGVTCFTLFPVYIPMICASHKNYCQLDVSCVCTLHVYDTLKKEIVLSFPIEINDSQVLKGQYSHKSTDRDAVTRRTQNMIYNDLLKYFDRAYTFIKEQGE